MFDIPSKQQSSKIKNTSLYIFRLLLKHNNLITKYNYIDSIIGKGILNSLPITWLLSNDARHHTFLLLISNRFHIFLFSSENVSL